MDTITIKNMGLKGAADNDKAEFAFNVTISYDIETDKEAFKKYTFGGQSARVALQAQLRSWTEKELRALEVKGTLDCTLAGISSGSYRKSKGQKESGDTYKDSLRRMTRAEAVADVMERFDQTEEAATAFIDKVRA